ncbi:PREDICTED: HVA22-like protein b [Tarenaya hassleriana]|uniref:HVA22-like protein b n=1 Tax=Tarenaya hassleriana TaxID=28532 RepID=UPI00053C5A29|nr:PREDICTED: HVA22-like protein b [Tarenaya hassleriana]
MSSGAGNFLKVVFKNFDVLAGPVVGLVYPLYASVRAIESKSPGDDKQWLTYWVLYSLITLFELTFYKVIEWIPIWPYAKLILTCWLVIPCFSGAAYVYEHFVRPLFVNSQAVNVWYVPGKKDDDFPLPAGKSDINQEPFEKRVRWADTSAKNVGYSVFDEDYRYY